MKIELPGVFIFGVVLCAILIPGMLRYLKGTDWSWREWWRQNRPRWWRHK